ncbi:hypothetical protein YC2023_089427 [Brassica napus]
MSFSEEQKILTVSRRSRRKHRWKVKHRREGISLTAYILTRQWMEEVGAQVHGESEVVAEEDK